MINGEKVLDHPIRWAMVGGDTIACVSYFGFPEKMAVQAPILRERIERELLQK